MKLPVASNDSWYWFVGLLDLRTGAIIKVPIENRLDFHGATWTNDGAVLGVGLDTRGPLWRFRRIERSE